MTQTKPPAEVAQRTGRTLRAVYRRRRVLHQSGACFGRWTAAEDELVRTLPPAEAARRTGRTIEAVYRRHVLFKQGERLGRRG